MSRRLRLLGWVLAALLQAVTAHAADIPASQRRPGAAFMGPALQAMQDDDSANPASLWVMDGQQLWQTKAGDAARSCADCHGEAASMRGVAARYPVAEGDRVIDLEARIAQCVTERQKAPAPAFESHDLLALTALVARQSRGQPIAIAETPRIAEGEALFRRRQGQLNLSCAQCHDENWGKHLGGAVIPQAHPTGYPIYRLEWQAMGSLQRRLRNCMTGMRAEPYPYGSTEAALLELYLMWRARGMAMDAPAVRP